MSDEKTALELAALVETFVPEAKEELKAYRSAESGAARKFAGIFVMLKYPGTRPTVDCGVSAGRRLWTGSMITGTTGGAP